MVTAVWELPADAPVPSSLDLSVQGEAFRPRDNLYAAPGWFAKGPVAKVVLPLSVAHPSRKHHDPRGVLRALVALSVVALIALKETTPSYAMLTGPIVTRGRMRGRRSPGARSAVKFRRFARPRCSPYESFGRKVERSTSGVWLVVTVDAAASTETLPLQAATIVGASGRSYRQSTGWTVCRAPCRPRPSNPACRRRAYSFSSCRRRRPHECRYSWPGIFPATQRPARYRDRCRQACLPSGIGDRQ